MADLNDKENPENEETQESEFDGINFENQGDSDLDFTEDQEEEEGQEEEEEEEDEFGEEEESEEEEEGEEENQEEEEEEGEGDDSEENNEEENLFENLSSEENPNEGEEKSQDYSSLASEFGIDGVTDKASYITKMKSLLEEKGKPLSENEGLNDVISTMVEVEKNGGDYRVITNTQSKIVEQEAIITREEQVIKSATELIKADIGIKRQVLSTYYAENGFSEEEAKEAAEDLDPIQVNTQILSFSQLKIAEAKPLLNAAKNEKTLLEGKVKEYSGQVANDAKAADEKMNGAIEKFKSDHPNLTSRAQNKARAAYSGSMKQISMKEGLMKLFFCDEQGNYSPETIMKNIATLTNKTVREDHLKKLAKVESFRKSKNFKGNKQKKAKRQKSSEEGEFDGGIVLGG